MYFHNDESVKSSLKIKCLVFFVVENSEGLMNAIPNSHMVGFEFKLEQYCMEKGWLQCKFEPLYSTMKFFFTLKQC